MVDSAWMRLYKSHMHPTIHHLRRLCFALLLCLPCAHVLAAADDQYTTCTELARVRPAESLKMADRWIQESNVASAHHCRAISLFALKRFGDAGQSLETLGQMIVNDNPMIWSNVMRQAAKSWELSGDKARALVTLTKAIALAADEGLHDAAMARIASDLLYDRSKLYAAGGRDLYAIQDLDQAISLSPANDVLLMSRAEILFRQHEGTLAMSDVNKILAKKPNHAPALELKSKIEAM